MPSKKSAANQTLGKAIRVARRQRGVSAEDFARSVALDRSYYSAIERGEFNVTVDTLVKIAGGFGMTIANLFQCAGL
jgi:transcriptional regulator with XRE-family HTH domain